ncbi:DedA family protein [Candidatus Nomurabacteria bacterium]|nr:DedA family protein [Candidatus Nomurabacteria bacterium]
MIFKSREKFKNYFLAKIESPNVRWWLSIISFLESSFFPIPPDPFLMASLLRDQRRWLTNSLLVAVTSILGGLFGYFLGLLFFETFGNWIVETYHLQNELIQVTKLFNENAFWALFTAAFTPIPYKIFTITAGLLKVNIFIFIIASVIGRTLRFLFVGLIMKMFGPQISNFVFKYFNWLTFAIGLVIIFYIIIQFI